MNTRILSLTLVILFGGCSVDTGEDAGFDESAWEAELLEHRAQKDEEFKTSSTSPMAGTQYLKSEPTDRAWLTREGKTFGLVYEEPATASLLLEKTADGWRWTAQEEGVTCSAKDEEVADWTALEGPAAFVVGGLQLSFYPSEERVTFIVFDSERPEMVAFEHLLYFPPDRTYAVEAQLVRFEEPDTIEVLTSRNLVKTFYRYARIQFQLEGSDQELTAFKSSLDGPGSAGLFVPFRDGTSGHETYGAGRFLEIDEPEGDRLVLDFNRCFNPLCNYSPAYNCAIPPRENHLEVPIRAGEKTYPH